MGCLIGIMGSIGIVGLTWHAGYVVLALPVLVAWWLLVGWAYRGQMFIEGTLLLLLVSCGGAATVDAPQVEEPAACDGVQSAVQCRSPESHIDCHEFVGLIVRCCHPDPVDGWCEVEYVEEDPDAR